MTREKLIKNKGDFLIHKPRNLSTGDIIIVSYHFFIIMIYLFIFFFFFKFSPARASLKSGFMC